MTQTVRIISCNPDGTAQVMHIRQSACSGDCHKCSGCGAVQETLVLTAKNPIGAGPGDQVVMESRTGPVLKAAAVVYMLPLVLFFLGYFLGNSLWDLGAAVGCAGFLAGIALCVAYGKRFAKSESLEYTITGYAPE